MLEILNNMKPFFEDCYRRVGVREYARLAGVSPPTASKMLKSMERDGLLVFERDRKLMLFSASKTSPLFIGLSRLYWLHAMEKSGLLACIRKEVHEPVVVLFGSLSKAEAKHDSDIDLAVFSAAARKPDIGTFEKKLGRKIQLFAFRSRDGVDSPELLNNILNGFIVSGGW